MLKQYFLIKRRLLGYFTPNLFQKFFEKSFAPIFWPKMKVWREFNQNRLSGFDARDGYEHTDILLN